MTEKQDETCENCGHDRDSHAKRKIKRFGVEPTECHIYECSCKRFDHSPSDMVDVKPSEIGIGFLEEGTFNLSEKLEGNMFRYVDVRKFIQRLKDEIKLRHGIDILDLLPEIDKLAGEELR